MSMQIEQIKEGDCLTVLLRGRLDTNTAAAAEAEVFELLSGVKELVLDLSELEYISSAGLRSILLFQKKMRPVGKMKLTRVRPEVMEILEVTGFTDFLTIE